MFDALNKKKLLKKATVFSVLFSFVVSFAALPVLAQIQSDPGADPTDPDATTTPTTTATTTTTTTTTTATTTPTPQATSTTVTVASTTLNQYNPSDDSSDSGLSLGGVASFVATCAITSFVDNAAKSALSRTIGAATNWLKSKLQGAITGAITGALGIGPQEVPTRDSKTRTNTEQTVQNTGTLAQKEVTGSAPTGGSSILSGIASDLFKSPSLDALAFCIGNELIHYILRSTIQWVNSGFKGKPVFIENPDQFFKNIADQEAGLFINEIMSGAGINVCQPFKVQLAVDSIRTHTNSYKKTGQCTLSAIQNNFQGFMNSFNQGGLPGWFEVIQKPNNIYGARMQAQQEINKRVSQRQNTLQLELNWASGYRNFKYCDGPKRADGSCDPKYEKTGTPGKIIESTINQRISSPQHRLEIADEFDELVSALVNALVKNAINEISSLGSNSSSNTSQVTMRDMFPPIITFTAPVSPLTGTVTLTATATDTVAVRGVQFNLNGQTLQPEDRTPPYSITWDTSTVATGTHRLSATARDNEGNTATTAEISVTVTR